MKHIAGLIVLTVLLTMLCSCGQDNKAVDEPAMPFIEGMDETAQQRSIQLGNREGSLTGKITYIYKYSTAKFVLVEIESKTVPDIGFVSAGKEVTWVYLCSSPGCPYTDEATVREGQRVTAKGTGFNRYFFGYPNGAEMNPVIAPSPSPTPTDPEPQSRCDSGGVEVDGHCVRMADSLQSCNSACAGYGGYRAATQTYLNNRPNCFKATRKFVASKACTNCTPVPENLFDRVINVAHNGGCAYNLDLNYGIWFLVSYPATTGDALAGFYGPFPGFNRMCVCGR